MIFAGIERASVDERGFEALRSAREKLNDQRLPEFKATVREQFAMLMIDTEAALAAIPSMLPDDAAARQKAFNLISEVLRARGELSVRDRERVERIRGLFRAGGELPVSDSPALAADDPEWIAARAM